MMQVVFILLHPNLAGKLNNFSSSSRGYRIPRYMVQDIDTPEDWANAELLYKLTKDQYI